MVIVHSYVAVYQIVLQLLIPLIQCKTCCGAGMGSAGAPLHHRRCCLTVVANDEVRVIVLQTMADGGGLKVEKHEHIWYK